MACLPAGAVTILWLLLAGAGVQAGAAIDRPALLGRHNPHLTRLEPASPLTVGNGGFAFTADGTGLQTFSPWYEARGVPLETLARWAWYEEPNPQRYDIADASELIPYHGREISFPTRDKTPAGQWLRRNPRDFPLGELGFAGADGRPLDPSEVSDIDQTLDLWDGELHSRFRWRGSPVTVRTAAGANDAVLVEAVSPELRPGGRLRLLLSFPRGHDVRLKNTPPLDWSQPDTHRTDLVRHGVGMLIFRRQRGSLVYYASVRGPTAAAGSPLASGPHRFLLGPDDAGRIALALAFSATMPQADSAASPNFAAARERWHDYWRRSAMVDFAGSADPRAGELERRVVLSQYLLAAQYRGDVPPSETGLTCSSWYGKHNTEMVWWHTAHFALWGHPEATAQALDWYRRTLPSARERARAEGLAGARWPKMCGPEGRESPGGNPLIAWNQPHPIELAELLYRAAPCSATIDRWSELVEATAQCMSSMLTWNPGTSRYDLGPPLWIAQEIYNPKTTRNSTYELTQWRDALETAQAWRTRAGQPRETEWDRRLGLLAPLPTRDGLYVAAESTPDTWTNAASRHDHPSFLLALGPTPGAGVDAAVMRRTLAAVEQRWDWETKIWGWDYPMMAMTAARLRQPDTAVDLLLRAGPNNAYLPNGNCPQRGDLGLYLPANGALLSAVALMVAGWDGGPPQPGIPHDGRWAVRAEGLRPLF